MSRYIKGIFVAISLCLSYPIIAYSAQVDMTELLKVHEAYIHAKNKGDHTEAIIYARKALALSKRSNDQIDIPIEGLTEDLATLLLEVKKYDEAEVFLIQTLKLRESSLGLDHPDLVELLIKLLQAKLGLDKVEEAQNLSLRILAIENGVFGKDHPRFAMTLKSIKNQFFQFEHPWDEMRMIDNLPETRIKMRGLSSDSFTLVRVFYGTNRKQNNWYTNNPKTFYGSKNGSLELGFVDVSIPENHEVGRLEGVSRYTASNPNEHIVVLTLETKSTNEFVTALSAHVQKSVTKEVFIFVHGYNVSFYDSARRTAQLAFDLKFEGTPILYSWPSEGSVLGYLSDEKRISNTVDELTKFLRLVAEESKAERIHIIAHSMGNRATIRALDQLAKAQGEGKQYFDQVLLTAPDVDTDVFVELMPSVKKVSRRVTLYCSENDLALSLSNLIHFDSQRAGQCSSQSNMQSEFIPVVLPGIDTINMSSVETDNLGHSYYGDHEGVLNDISQLVSWSTAPSDRCGMNALSLKDRKYWEFSSSECVGDEVRTANLLLKRYRQNARKEVLQRLNKKKKKDEIREWQKILEITNKLFENLFP